VYLRRARFASRGFTIRYLTGPLFETRSLSDKRPGFFKEQICKWLNTKFHFSLAYLGIPFRPVTPSRQKTGKALAMFTKYVMFMKP